MHLTVEMCLFSNLKKKRIFFLGNNKDTKEGNNSEEY